MQLEIWPPTPQSPQSLQVWERLSPQQRAKLIATLARLMRKAVRTEPRRDTDER